MAIAEHVAVVRGGFRSIAAWRDENPDSKLNLRGAMLRRADLSRANLSGADLCGANLEWADLRWADLVGTDMSGCSMDHADLHKADLGHASLAGATLRLTNLEDANLQSADVGRAVFAHTKLVNTNLARARRMSGASHRAPSSIDADTLNNSGHISKTFLRGCGLSDAAIGAAYADDVRSLSTALEAPGLYYSCFISYSSQDGAFARQLYKDLQASGVRCWFDKKDMLIGEKILDSIHQAIRKHEKLLVILSKHSVSSGWVEDEVTKAYEEERDRGQTVVFPVRIDDDILDTEKAWAEKIRASRNIGDFCNWRSKEGYKGALIRLLSSLRRQAPR